MIEVATAEQEWRTWKQLMKDSDYYFQRKNFINKQRMQRPSFCSFVRYTKSKYA